MSTRRGRHRQQTYSQADENRTVRPLYDQNQGRPAIIEAASSSSSSSSSSLSSSSSSSSSWHSNPGNSKRAPRNRPRFLEKSELGSLNSCEEVSLKEDEGGSADENSSFLNVDSSGAAFELNSSSSCDQDSVPKEEEKCTDGHSSVSNNDFDGRVIEDLDAIDEVDYVRSRFQELMLNTEEPELSEELIMSNDHSQEDELLALESIYGDSIIVLDREGGLRCFQVYIHIDAPGELTVSTKLNSSGDPIVGNDDSPGFLYSFNVQYLPPIVLTCLLPKSYPSHRSPYFTILVQWLNSAQISKLCSMLDSIWKEQQGAEVIYQWVGWLHNFSLTFLGFDQEIILGPYGVTHLGDTRAISKGISADIDIPFMKSYNDEQCHENFCKNFHKCGVCFDKFAGTNFIRLPCQHFFCWKCMKTFSDMHVKEGTILQLQCPEAKCGGMFPPALLKCLVSEEAFERYESLILQKTLESMSDVAYCPRCETACIEDDDQDAQCSKCFFSFCTLCWESRHVGVACMTPDIKLIVLQDRQNSSQLKNEQRRREQEMINELLSVKEIRDTTKQCPICRMPIIKAEGCNKMTCANCGNYFCYKCNSAITGYEHFREGKCDLFPQEEIRLWEERINGRQVVGQIQAELHPERGHSCPNCGQLNVKMGNNNHILCWACQSHYCYLCRKTVRRSTQHFGPKGCKQHTVG